MVLRVGDSGELQVVYAHEDPRVQSIADIVSDTATSARTMEAYSRKTTSMSTGELRAIVKEALGKSIECVVFLDGFRPSMLFVGAAALRGGSKKRPHRVAPQYPVSWPDDVDHNAKPARWTHRQIFRLCAWLGECGTAHGKHYVDADLAARAHHFLDTSSHELETPGNVLDLPAHKKKRRRRTLDGLVSLNDLDV